MSVETTFKPVWGVVTGEYVLEHLLPDLYIRQKIPFERGLTGKILKLEITVAKPKKLKARCDFIKVNNAAVALFMPQNRWVNHRLLEQALAAASGIALSEDPFRSRLRTALTMHPILSPDSPDVDGKIPLSERVKSGLSESFQEVDYLVKIDDELTLRRIKEKYPEYKAPVHFTYGDMPEGTLECLFHQQIALINGMPTTFLYSVGDFEDRKMAFNILSERNLKSEAIFTEGRLPLI